MTKRVAILTGGGDVPGLNMCLKSLIYRLIDLSYEPIGIRKGWEGLINYNPADPTTYSEHFIGLTKNMVRPIDRTPGSFLHSSRLDPRQTPAKLIPDFLRQGNNEFQDTTGHIKDVIQRLGYRALIVIGDDDTLHFAAHLHQQGVPILAIPKTIHNNIHGTDYTLGFSTGLARGVSFVHELRALAGSREQTIVVETFAAKSGYSTLLMAFLAGVDRVLIPEVPYNADKLAGLVKQDKRETPANYAVLLVCDGTLLEAEQEKKYASFLASLTGREYSGEKSSSNIIKNVNAVSSGLITSRLLTYISGEEALHQPLTYLLRTGAPDGQDLLGAANFAITAANLLHEGAFGRMTAFVQDRMWTHVDLNLATEGVKTVEIDKWYDPNQYKPDLSLIWSIDHA